MITNTVFFLNIISECENVCVFVCWGWGVGRGRERD